MPLICVASPKGGAGKTTFAANLADALRRAGRRVLAMDLDPQNMLRLHFTIPLSDRAGFTATLPQHPDWHLAARTTPSGVALLPHGTVELRSALALAGALEREPELLAAPVRAMLADPGLVIVADLPPGPSHALDVLTPMAAIVVAVLLPDATSAALMAEIDSGRFLGSGALSALLAGRFRVVLNQVDPNSRFACMAEQALTRHLGPRLLGTITRDEAVAEALAQQRTLLDAAPDCRAADDLRRIAYAVNSALPMPAEGDAGGYAR